MDYLLIERELRVIGESGEYPSKDDCLVVEVLNEDGQFMYKISHMPKVEHEILLVLKELAKTSIPQDIVKELAEKIEAYGQRQYERGGMESDEEYHM